LLKLRAALEEAMWKAMWKIGDGCGRAVGVIPYQNF